MLSKIKGVFSQKPVESYAASQVYRDGCKFNFTAMNMRFNKVNGFFAQADFDVHFNIKDFDNSCINITWPVAGIRTGITE